jgi:glutaredoxin
MRWSRAFGRRFGLWALLLAAFAMIGLLGCRRRATDDLQQESAEEKTKTLPPLTLSDETPDLLLTWIDERGDAHVANKPADVPAERRDKVRVVVTTREDGTHGVFYVANLSSKSADGTYPVATLPRSEWDAMISERRRALAGPVASAESEDEPAGPGPRGPAAQARPAVFTVIVYGASWCGACHEAVAYLKSRKVPVIEKDIEQDAAAQSEMQAKLARAGVHGGSIPVIDVRGKILIGFEPHALEAAMRGAGGAVTL